MINQSGSRLWYPLYIEIYVKIDTLDVKMFGGHWDLEIQMSEKWKCYSWVSLMYDQVLHLKGCYNHCYSGFAPGLCDFKSQCFEFW